MARTEIRSQTLDVTTLRPLRDQVLVEIVEKSRIGNIEIVQQKGKADYVTLAKVVSVGTGIHEDKFGKVFPMGLEPADEVILMDYSGERIDVNGKKYRMIREHGIWATVKTDTKDLFDFKEIEPRFDTIVIKPRDEEMTESGTFYLPNGNSQCQYRRATVIKTGPGIWFAPTGTRQPVGVCEGDEIIFQRYAGANVTLNGDKVRLIQEADIVTGA